MLRVAAISFLNPAPLMWDFEHAPLASRLAERYTLHYTQPSLCADELLSARADLGLIPIASLTPDLAIVPGCTIASLNEVRSIQLIIKSPHTLSTVRTIAADTASRSSLAYAEVLFRKFLNTRPKLVPVAAVRPEALGPPSVTPAELTEDLEASRNHGLLNIEKLVEQWTPRIAIPPATIRHYLSSNIHYILNTDSIRAIERFRQYAAEVEVLPPLPHLRFL